MAARRERCPWRSRTGTERVDSAAITPGSRSISYRASAESGCAKLTVTSWRWATLNWTSSISSMAPVMNSPTIRIAAAAAMPVTELKVRPGRRRMLRSTIRAGGDQPASETGALHPGPAIAGRRLGPHRLGRRQ